MSIFVHKLRRSGHSIYENSHKAKKQQLGSNYLFLILLCGV